VSGTQDAARSIEATEAHVTFAGIHRPALYSMSSAAKMTSFIPTSDVPVQLLGGRRWLAVLGSVGQPRDGNPAAFAMLDTLARDHLLPRAVRRRGGGRAHSRQRPAALAGRSPAGGKMRMAKPEIAPGAELDGFTIGECVHQGGMATLWTVTHPGSRCRC
jgi:hypothetical protein